MIFFVTGGSRGIGAAIVLQAIREGHSVAFTYLESAGLATEIMAQAQAIRPDARCQAYQLDVRSSRAVDQVGEQVLEDFETVDAVVANAGVNRNNLAVSMSDDEWHTV